MPTSTITNKVMDDAYFAAGYFPDNYWGETETIIYVTIPVVDTVRLPTQIRPDGARQPEAESWVLIKINMQLLNAAPTNDRKFWP